MQGKHQHIGNVIFWLSCLLLLFGKPAIATENSRIVIVKSSDNEYFSQTVQTLINQVDLATEFRVINADKVYENRALLANSGLVIALGRSSTVLVTRQFPQKPIISAYLTLQQWQSVKPRGKNHIAVLLDQPLERYLAFAHYLLGADSIGIINRVNLDLNRKQKSTLSQLKTRLNQYQINQTENLLPNVRQLIQQNDVLLMLPDHDIYSHDSLRGILLTSYRNRTPVLSYSPAHVKSGALASIYSSPVNIGKHIGDLVNLYLVDRLDYRESPLHARYFSIRTNDSVAHSLQLELPGKGELRNRLQEISQ